MDYIGEHRLPGLLGHFFAVLSLVASLLATFSYLLATLGENRLKIYPGHLLSRFIKLSKILLWTGLFFIIFFSLFRISERLYHHGFTDIHNIDSFFTSKTDSSLLRISGIIFLVGLLGQLIGYISGDTLQASSQTWKKIARLAFIVEVISVISIFVILFHIISNHLFEYKYAWQHSSLALEAKYLLACFWEGQEGSFLLWSVWHCVLGLVLIKTSKQWEAPVMTIVSFAQFCLASMIVGIYVFGEKIGSNPFSLLRESSFFDQAPVFHVGNDINNAVRPDYMSLSTMKDGNGLNPLLQNYWMVIHPPVLFMGFASTIVPFAFAIAGLWTKKFGDWIRPALPWSLFSAAVLGVGIMMGAAWAYESLTFGGYWAWDPVENASLVPWMILIAAIHTLLIYKHSGHSLRATHLFIILSFFFVLYSTFLTRSGILGDSSVHAFTDLGLNVQLYLLLYVFVWLSAIFSAKSFNQRIIAGITSIGLLLLILLAYDYTTGLTTAVLCFLSLIAGIVFLIYEIQTQVPTIAKEESATSREFWMFIGALVFFLSAIVIISKTSLPVFNKIFGTKWAAPENPEYAYNQIQVNVAIILGALTAITQYLRYKNTSWKFFQKAIWIPTLIAAIVASLVLAFGNINYNKETFGFLVAIWVAVAASIYAAIANLSYIWIGVKGKLKLSGGSISHFGFGLVLLGILISSSKKEVLSYNHTGIAIPFGKDSKEKSGENMTLIKNLPMKMGKFDVTYVGDSMHPKKKQWYYKVHFKSREDNEEFTLKPNAFVNYKENEGLMSNPDSRHYWDHDVFTYISSVNNPEKKEDTSSFHSHVVKQGDSIFYSKGYIILEKLAAGNNIPVKGFNADDSAIVARLRVHSMNGTSYGAESFLVKKNNMLISMPDTVMPESLILQLNGFQGDSADIGVKESGDILEYVTLKAYKFPFIFILWGGIIITAIGILISMVRRIQLNRLSAKD